MVNLIADRDSGLSSRTFFDSYSGMDNINLKVLWLMGTTLYLPDNVIE